MPDVFVLRSKIISLLEYVGGYCFLGLFRSGRRRGLIKFFIKQFQVFRNVWYYACMTTIKDIANALGIGVSTVSMALNDNPKISQKTRDKVKAKAEEMHFVKNTSAANLRSNKTNLILLVVNDASLSFFSDQIKIIQKEVALHGYDLLISTTFEGHDETAKKYLSEHRADGAIIQTVTLTKEQLQKYAAEDFPILSLNGYKGKNLIGVRNTNQTLYENALDYLIAQGHKRFAFIKGSPYSNGTIRKYSGFMKSIHAHNISLENYAVFDANGGHLEDGYSITNQMLPYLNNFDVLIYSNCEIAMGGLQCLQDNYIKVPEDISLMGIGSPLFHGNVITTYDDRVNDSTYVAKCVQLLFMKLENKNYSSLLQQLESEKYETVIRDNGTVAKLN